MDMVYFRVVM